MTEPRFTAKTTPTLTPRAQGLVDAYEATYGSTGPGCCPQALAAVLDAMADDKPGPVLGYPSNYLRALAAELRGKS